MRTYESNDVARFFLARSNPEYGDLLSNLKLQKLCYYGAGLIAAVRKYDGAPLFSDRIEAWLHGPVVPRLYREYKSYGADAIPPVERFDFSIFEERDRRVLDDVYDFYGQYSAWKLRNMTHEEQPWIVAYEQNDKTISNSALRAFFEDEIGDDYAAAYHA